MLLNFVAWFVCGYDAWFLLCLLCLFLLLEVVIIVC